MRHVPLALAALALAVAGACHHLRPVKPAPAVAEPSADGVIDLAIVTEDIDLPAGSVLHVKLIENGEVPIGGTTVTELDASPVRCSVSYDPVAIDPEAVYEIEARAASGNDLLGLNLRPAEVITHGHGRGLGIVLENR